MIRTEPRGTVELITLDRHERRNALDTEHCTELRAAVEKAVSSDVRALVITGAGTSFCAGADLSGVYGDGFGKALSSMLDSIREAPLPVVAAVNGPAIGAGTQLAMACDLRVADATARFAIPTGGNGLAVDLWTVRRLALLAGGGSARAVLIGGDTLDASLAVQRGLVDRLGDLAAALEWAEQIASFAPLSLRYSKAALESLFEQPHEDPDVQAAWRACWNSADAVEGRRAGQEKRPPRFLGR
jgi:enoyl-CoA hydratase